MLFIPVIAASIYQHMDKVMLGLFVNKTEVGYYESATKLVVISLGIITAILSVISPKLSNMWANKNKKVFNKLFNISLIFVMAVGIALAFGIAAISKEFVPIFFGKGYIKSIGLTMILSISIIFISWSNTFRWLYFIPKDHDKIYVKSVIVGAVVNLISNIILIPILNSYGAAIGTVLAEASVAIYQTYSVRKEIDLKYYLKKCLTFLVFGLIMFVGIRLFSYFVNDNIIAIILRILIGVVIYMIFIGIYFYKSKGNLFLKEDLIFD